jgi:two-component system cell cycle sensor histidine kinase/response regulator CckA
LPVSDGPVKPALPKEPERIDIGAGSVVLVVEDEAALGAAVAESLADAGFVVDRAGDGEEALGRVQQRAYDLIICDLKMPRVDGMTFYRTLEREHPEAARRILFVTGDVAGTEAERFLDETGCRWLAKPFRLRDLLRTATEILG